MVTQARAHGLQRRLIAAERLYRHALNEIADCATASNVALPLQATFAGAVSDAKLAMKAAHDAAGEMCVSAGIEPLSGGGDKDDDPPGD